MTGLTTSDDPLTGDFRIKCDFTAPRVWQPMAGGLVLLRLDAFARNRVPTFSEKERRLPVGLSALKWSDEVRLALPAGMAVDELPAKVELSSPYGTYSIRPEFRDGVVTLRRTLELPERNVPVGEYAALRKFFSDVAKNDRISVVLRAAAVVGDPAP